VARVSVSTSPAATLIASEHHHPHSRRATPSAADEISSTNSAVFGTISGQPGTTCRSNGTSNLQPASAQTAGSIARIASA
jgi:hypothetical protein